MGKYDLVKAVTQKLMRISKNPALFLSCLSWNYYIIEKNVKKTCDQLRPSRQEFRNIYLYKPHISFNNLCYSLFCFVITNNNIRYSNRYLKYLVAHCYDDCSNRQYWSRLFYQLVSIVLRSVADCAANFPLIVKSIVYCEEYCLFSLWRVLPYWYSSDPAWPIQLLLFSK